MLYNLISKTYRSMVYTRADDTGAVFYFTAKDFPGLHTEPVTVRSSCGHDLLGAFYWYDDPIPGRVVLFEHGMGSGHTGYMKEIELLCRHGFRVFAYDHTGCMSSGGETTGGFAQSLCDCNDVLNALAKEEGCAGCTFSVIGHSWGGLSTLNIAAFHPEVTHIVSLAAPISVSALICGMFSGILAKTGKRLAAEETAQNPVFGVCDARTSLPMTEAHILVLHSSDDPTVSCAAHFDVLKSALGGKDNIRFVKVEGKAHNPNYTADAVKYKDAFFAEYKKALKKKQLVTDEQKNAFRAGYDWNRMTEQDASVWDMIFETLDKPAPGECSHAH